MQEDVFLAKMINCVPYMSREEEKEVLAQLDDPSKSEEARAKLILSHIRLASKIANSYRSYGLPVPDLIQEGNIGLIEASKKFDNSKNVRFSTYAIWWIRAYIQAYIISNFSMVKNSSTTDQRKLFFSYRRLRSQIEMTNDLETSFEVNAKIAEMLGISTKTVEEFESRNFRGTSLNVKIGDGSDDAPEMIDVIDSGDECFDEIHARSQVDEERRHLIWSAMQTMTDRERSVLTQRHLSDEAVTLETIGSKFGVSRERIRQIEVSAFKKIKKYMSENDFVISNFI